MAAAEPELGSTSHSRARRSRLAIIVAAAVVIVGGVGGVNAYAARRLDANVARAVDDVDAVLSREAPRISAEYPRLSAGGALFSLFDEVEGARLVVAFQSPAIDNGIRLAFKTTSLHLARCIRYTVGPDGAFSHDVVDDDC